MMSSTFPFFMLYDHYLFLRSFVACCYYLILDLWLQDLLGLEGDDLAQFKALIGERYTLQKIPTVEDSPWIVVSYSSLLVCSVYVWLSHMIALVS